MARGVGGVVTAGEIAVSGGPGAAARPHTAPPAATETSPSPSPSPPGQPSVSPPATPTGSDQGSAPPGRGGNNNTLLLVVGSLVATGLGGALFLGWLRRRTG